MRSDAGIEPDNSSGARTAPSTGVATWVWDTTQDRVHWFSDPSPLYGLEAGCFDGGFAAQMAYVHPDDRAASLRAIRECLSGALPSYRQQRRVIWPDGSVHWLEIYCSSRRGADGRVVELSGAIIDCSERKRAEMELADSEQQFSKIFRAVATPMVLSRRRDGLIRYVNDAWIADNGVACADAVGTPGESPGHWTDLEARRRIVAEVDANGRCDDVLVAFARPDGRLRQILVSCVRLELGGEAHLLWSSRDVTELHQALGRERDMRNRYRALFETSPMAVVLVRRRDGVLLEINESWLVLTGCSTNGCIGRPVEQLGFSLESSDGCGLLTMLGHASEVDDVTVRLRRPDGQIIEVLLAASEISIEGDPCLLSSWSDLTALREAERARQDTERRYRQLFDEALDGVLVLSPEGEVLNANRALCQLTGHESGDLVGQDLSLIAPAPARRRWTGHGRRLASGPQRFETDVLRQDGSTVRVDVRAGRMVDGNIQVFVRDVAERRRAEGILTHLARAVTSVVGEAFFRTLITQLARELGADYAFAGTLVAANKRMRTLALCMDGEERPNFEYDVAGSPCELAVSRRGTLSYVDRTAELFPGDPGLARLGVRGYVGISLFDSQDNALGVLVVMSRSPLQRSVYWESVLELFAARAGAELERTRAEQAVREANQLLERRVAERTTELERANRELESFSYSISHDLRAPLRAIGGFTGLLRQDYGKALPEEAEHFLERIESGASRMGELIDDLLEFSRAARAELVPTCVDMQALAESVVHELRETYGAGTRLVLEELAPGSGDARLLRQVWQNLIDNAFKFSSKAPAPEIRIGCEQSQTGTRYFVTDNGAGFDPQRSSKLFGVFQRLHPVSEFEGTGAGLAIAKRIIERHGGHLSAEGQVGAGATFSFSLPCAARTQQAS